MRLLRSNSTATSWYYIIIFIKKQKDKILKNAPEIISSEWVPNCVFKMFIVWFAVCTNLLKLKRCCFLLNSGVVYNTREGEKLVEGEKRPTKDYVVSYVVIYHYTYRKWLAALIPKWHTELMELFAIVVYADTAFNIFIG